MAKAESARDGNVECPECHNWTLRFDGRRVKNVCLTATCPYEEEVIDPRLREWSELELRELIREVVHEELTKEGAFLRGDVEEIAKKLIPSPGADPLMRFGR